MTRYCTSPIGAAKASETSAFTSEPLRMGSTFVNRMKIAPYVNNVDVHAGFYIIHNGVTAVYFYIITLSRYISGIQSRASTWPSATRSPMSTEISSR